MLGEKARTFGINSRPLMPSIFMSLMTRSGRCVVSSRRASSPETAVRQVYRSLNRSESNARTPASSSTINISGLSFSFAMFPPRSPGNMANENDKPEILIVDDEAGVRALLSDLFSERYTCLTAVSGDEALQLLTTQLPDVVISGINMGGMRGLELISKVLAFSPNIVVMMISGSQTIDTAIESIRVGAFDFIRKPFELDEVEIAVERALDHHRLLVEKQRHEEQLEVLVAERTRQLNYVANYDALTGLPNRTLFEDRLAQAIVQADDGRGVAVLLLSSDRVKEVHDTLGHLISERILREFIDRLTTSLPLGSTVARFEADQFALLLPDIKSNLDITTVAEDVFRAIESSFLVEGHDIFLSVAIGISVFPDDGTDGQSLMKHAGVALSRARTSGSNTYQFFTGRMHAKALRRLTLQNDLRHALENNELKAYYQPKIDMNTGTIVGMEALIRWRHPQLGSLSPADFISIA